MFYTQNVAARVPRKSRTKRMPAPVRGMIRNENIALTKPAGAYLLENFFPTSTGIRSRRGVKKHATLAGSSAVAAIIPYQGSGVEKLFAANNSGIFDITTVANPNTPLTAASGIGTSTNGEYSYVQFANASGEYLLCVNGVNLHKVYNGSTWAENSPAITGTTTSNWAQIWSYANRIFGVVKDSQTAVYLPSAAIGGAATAFYLGGVFKLGGELLFGTSWSVDSGEGLDDLCVFVSTLGEVAVYAGADPASWSLQGVYKIGKPLGKNAWFKAGGDLVIATDDGLVPVSGAVNRDKSALQKIAVSYPIEELWIDEAQRRRAVPWTCATWPTEQMLVVATPTYGGAKAQVLVANTATGAWALFSGAYDCRGCAPFGDSFFFGTSNALVYEAEVAANDLGSNYTATMVGLFDDLDAPGQQKIMKLVRGIFQSGYQRIQPAFSVSTDYQISVPTPPAAAPEPSGTGLWGSSTWGAFVWGGSTARYRQTDWHALEGAGSSVAVQCQVTLGNTLPPDIELAALDLVYEVGDVVA